MNELNILKYVDDVIRFCEMQFPRKCNCCGYEFKDFKDFLKNTKIPDHVAMSNLQIIDFKDIHDVIAYRNCKCGTTITLPCSIGLGSKFLFLDTIEYDSKETGMSKADVAIKLRDEVLKKVLGDSTEDMDGE
ncbi:hypothetical protein LF845_00495 [Deferribacterales bacterium Es71-Z0220]|uniref:hypothetical protein n=1 Tax=Deferrivibrio essentukiensis TaxID=2880922 RepID=UPI001F61E95D|nr:hypothetical protein [Deferrivibrio essentukiensis]MCB4203433.1 hypothetical protein [Deferrivibrio essentukiensis]